MVRALCLFGALLLSISTTSANLVAGQCAAPYSATTDYFPDKAVVQYAAGFTVAYRNNYKVVTNTKVNETYVLYQCGTPAPDVPGANFTFSVPVTGVALGDTTYVPRIEQLGERLSIKDYIDTPEFIASPCLNSLIQNKTVGLAYNNDTTCDGTRINNTVLTADNVQATFVSFATSTCSANKTAADVLNRVIVSDNLERGSDANLATAEWLKFFSLFYNREAEANLAFSGIESRWDCTVSNADVCTQAPGAKPSVAWSPGFINGTGWFLTTDNSYYVEAVQKAGGNIIKCLTGSAASSSGFPSMTDAEYLACNSQADVCIFAQSYDEIFASAPAVLNQLKCVQNKRVFDNQGEGDKDWFESRFAQPDTLLQDIIGALHFDSTQYGIGAHKRRWIRKVFNETEAFTRAACTNTSAPFIYTADACIPVVATTCQAGNIGARRNLDSLNSWGASLMKSVGVW